MICAKRINGTEDAVEVTHPGGTHLSVNCVTWGMARDAAETAAESTRPRSARSTSACAPSAPGTMASSSAHADRAHAFERVTHLFSHVLQSRQ